MNHDPLTALSDLIAVFELLHIAYFVGGSFASGARGEYRATNDLDIICRITPQNAKAFLHNARSKFLIDELGFLEHIGSGKTYNILHEATFVKIDLFPRFEAFEKSELARASAVTIPGIPKAVMVASAEDIILSKLRWYRAGREQSERQWRDLLGVVKIQGDRFDRTYLEDWAKRLEVHDLLLRLLGNNS